MVGIDAVIPAFGKHIIRLRLQLCLWHRLTETNSTSTTVRCEYGGIRGLQLLFALNINSYTKHCLQTIFATRDTLQMSYLGTTREHLTTLNNNASISKGSIARYKHTTLQSKKKNYIDNNVLVFLFYSPILSQPAAIFTLNYFNQNNTVQ